MRSRWSTFLGALAPLVVTVGYLVYAVAAGLSGAHAVAASAVVVVLQILPGALVWRTLRPRDGWWWEDIAVGFGIGSVLAIFAQIIAGLVGVRWLSAVPLALVAIGLLVHPGTRARILDARTSPLPWWWGPGVAACTLLMLFQTRAYFRQVPLEWATGARVQHVDAPLHLALSAQLATRGPTKFPWVESESLAYHWFSHSWVAQVSNVSGAELDETLFRFLPVLMPIATALIAAVAAVRLSTRPWTGPVAAWLALVGGNFNVFGKWTPGNSIEPLSPSLGLGTPALLTIVIVLALGWRGVLPRAGTWVLLPLLCFGAAGTKGSTVPLVVAGLALALLACWCWDSTRLRAVAIDFGIVVAVLAVAYVVVFHGSSAGLAVDPAGAAKQTSYAAPLHGITSFWVGAAASTLSVIGLAARGVGTLALVADRERRREPQTWLLAGIGVAGVLATVVFSHPGASQGYFAKTAAPVLGVGSALGLVVLVERLGAARWRTLVIGAVGGPVLALVPYWLLGDDLNPNNPGSRRAALVMALLGAALFAGVVLVARRLGRSALAGWTAACVAVLVGGVTVVVNTVVQQRPPPRPVEVAATAPLAVSRDQIDAARFIRDHSDVDELVMTNRHCTSPVDPVGCDNRRFVVAAYTERQVLLEGWTPAPKAQEIAPEGRDSITVDYWHPELLALNDRFIATPTEADADELRSMDVRWVFVDKTRPHAATLEPFAALRLSLPGVDVYELV